MGDGDPECLMRFSVAIRMRALFNDGKAVLNVDGGIVFDSKTDADYDGCLVKARFAVGDPWTSR